MFRTAITIISALLAAAALAVPVASPAPPRTSTESQGFSLGTALYDYQQSKNGAESQVFSLGTALYEYQHGKNGAQAASKQGLLDDQRGAGSFATPTAPAGESGFDWWAAAIGAGIALGAVLVIGGIGTITVRARQARGAVGTT
jgi:opacity protein-like surface antigen